MTASPTTDDALHRAAMKAAHAALDAAHDAVYTAVPQATHRQWTEAMVRALLYATAGAARTAGVSADEAASALHRMMSVPALDEDETAEVAQ